MNPTHEQDVPPGVLDPAAEQQFLDGFTPDMPPFGTIGADGNDNTHGQALAYVMRVGREAHEAREPYLTQAVDNAIVYRYGQSSVPETDAVISNEIQPTVLSITDIQTREPFAVFIRPVQTRDKPQVFWIGPPVDPNVAMLTGLPPGLGMEPVIDPATGQPAMQPVADPMSGAVVGMQPVMQPATSYQPLDEITAWQVRKLAATGAFPAEWLCVLDDRLVADVYQTVFDLFWQETQGDDWVRENLLMTNVYGYQTGTYGWDARRKRHILRNVSIKQAFLDPNASTLDQMGYAGFDVVMDIDQAKSEYPQIAGLIEEYARIGSPSRVDSVSEFGVGSERQFWRRTVTFRVMFFRNQMVPMTPAEAQEAGLVQQGPDGGYYLAGAQEQPNAGQPAGEGSGLGDAGATGGGVVPTGGAEDGAGAEEAGEGTPPPAPEPSPAWPLIPGVRQVVTLALTGLIVQDIRCEHWDVPMLLNVCVPIPSQPFGQGIPEKLKGMQQADIRLLRACVKYAETFANPGAIIPQSVAAALKEGLKRTHIDPTETVVVPDNIAEKWGDKAVLWFEPPTLPPAVPAVMQMLDQRAKQTSGHPEVMQGVAPSPTSSGRMIEALQAGAAGQFGFQAQWTARMVQRAANLMHHSHLWRLDVPDLMRIYSRLPEQIMQMVVDRARAGRWDIQVDANSGASGQTNKKLQRALALFQAVNASTGEPALPLRMLREAANIDDEEASLAYRQEMQNAAPAPMVAPGGAPMPPGQQPPPGGAVQPESDGMGTAGGVPG